ncbi:MAG: glycoside hydrolase family 2 TIM barrel-domain containing protein [Polyangiaceae bacterium]
MLRRRLWILLLIGVGADRNARMLPEASPRLEISLNRGWKFALGDFPSAETSAFADETWNAVGLPHSFSEPYFLSSEFYTGYGWYRKHLTIPQAWQHKRIYLEFDGVFQVAEAFVNGRKIGVHQGGYTGFSFDVTESIHSGDNLLAVRVNNLWNPELAPRAGEHVFSGGIYRNVRLVITEPLHVTWYGTFVTTPKVSAGSAVVNVKTEIRNDGPEDKRCAVESDVVANDGRIVASARAAQSIASGTTVTFDQSTPEISRPSLWSPDHPVLYAVVTKVFDVDRSVLADTYRTSFGFRWFEWTRDRGFFINGEHRYFKGVNAHQDHAGWGDAVTDSGFDRDVRLIKDAGFDFVRGSHYPHAPAFSAACDRLGLLFWSENCFWGTASFKSPWGASAYPPEIEHQTAFENSVKESLRDEIRIHRNHPSIIVWSLGNEVFFTEPSTMPRVRQFIQELVGRAHEWDPTRPVAIGGVQRGDIDKLGDVAGYNGDGARLFLNPGIANVVSEYGSTVGDRPGPYDPGWGDLQTEEFQWRSGQALWCGFDHGSIAGHFGSMGMVDYFRLPKRQWFWYRNEYRHVPPPEWPTAGTPARLQLTADKTVIDGTDSTDDAQVVVTVLDDSDRPISNSPPVTLTIESGPGEFPTGPSITFAPDSDIAIRDGQAAIEWRSYDAGRTVIRARSPGLRDATLTLVTEGSPAFIAGETQTVAARPYVRFTADGPSTPEVLLGRDAPARASDEARDHPARLANDGHDDTFWSASSDAADAFWEVDLERLCIVRRVNITFPSPGNYRYRIETSDDHRLWRLAVDESQTLDESRARSHMSASGTFGRFVKITFTGLPPHTPARISEVAIVGAIRAQ